MLSASGVTTDFYPRPPGGGRRTLHTDKRINFIFLSTPSGWRATGFRPHLQNCNYNFYPRPPGGGRHVIFNAFYLKTIISIHALRVEGDARGQAECHRGLDFYPRPPGGGRPVGQTVFPMQDNKFLSTPSGWRATSAKITPPLMRF